MIPETEIVPKSLFFWNFSELLSSNLKKEVFISSRSRLIKSGVKEEVLL